MYDKCKLKGIYSKETFNNEYLMKNYCSTVSDTLDLKFHL